MRPREIPQPLATVGQSQSRRIMTGLHEFDRVLGGGVVEGSIILVGGPPGVGKSTLLLEVAARLSAQAKTLYVSAEESPEQIALRSQRLGKQLFDKVYISRDDQLEDVYGHIAKEGYKFVVVDSIQVVSVNTCEGTKGSASQVRGCADYLTQIAKSLGVVVFVVGHVTKEGSIAGPKILEHIVDCVLYFESETLSPYRILRSTKNRFGPTGDIAVFEMRSDGLFEVTKLTDIFLPQRQIPTAGSCATSSIEGVRPILIELQALVSRANFGIPRRRSLGYDFNRFSLLVAIIEKRLCLPLASEDVFLNVAGGLKINDPAADAGAVAAIVSSLKEKPIASDTLVIGEVGLGGELRRVNNINMRLTEAGRANFSRCLVPEVNLKEVDKKFGFAVQGIATLKDLIHGLFA